MIDRAIPGLVRAALLVAAILLPSVAGATPPASSETAGDPFPDPVLEALEAAFDAYEGVRADLATDRLENVATRSLQLSGALRLALARGDALGDGVIGTIASAARAAESMGDAADPAATRVAFGEVSRGLMLLARDDPRLKEGWHAFACPMADGYEKWLQPTAEIDNPYMGLSMPKCGTTADWSVTAAAPTEATPSSREAYLPRVEEGDRAEPVFKPGIPGLTMVDVRDHKFLWREIGKLQTWEHGGRLTVAEFRSKAIEKTVHFLELEGAAAEDLTATAMAAIFSLRQAFSKREATAGTSGVENVRDDLNAAVERVVSVLGDEPRHRLFAPGCKKWLLKLAFGPREAKEAREAAAQAESAQKRGS